MRKNGFTLIELLAVIVILAIIALIATPIILGIINDAREKANERSVELYASAVRNAVASYQLTNSNASTSFEDLNIQYDGDVKCAVQELYEDGSFYLESCKVNNGDKEYSYGTKKGSNKVCILEDKDGDGIASLSDEIKCGSEYFYVIKNDGNEIQMLTKYNLNVGDKLVEGATGIQNKMAVGYTTDTRYCVNGDCDNTSGFFGAVAYHESFYWSEGCDLDTYTCANDLLSKYGTSFPAYVYDNIASSAQYVNSYAQYLQKTVGVTSATATMINKEQLDIVGCDIDNYTCSSAPSWVYQTTYFTGLAHDGMNIYEVITDKSLAPALSSNDSHAVGIRPVVTVSTSEI